MINLLKYIKDIVKDEDIISDYHKKQIINILNLYDILETKDLIKDLKR